VRTDDGAVRFRERIEQQYDERIKRREEERSTEGKKGRRNEKERKREGQARGTRDAGSARGEGERKKWERCAVEKTERRDEEIRTWRGARGMKEAADAKEPL